MSKKQKVKVAEAGMGNAQALAHNPFAALAGASAPSFAESPGDVQKPAPVDAHARSPRARLILRRETKHRAGKGVVVIAGLRVQPRFDDAAIAELAQYLKHQLACGGTVERTPRVDQADECEIVLQGDQPARVAELLRARGFRVAGVTT